MGILAASGRIGAVSAQFINGSLEKNIPALIVVTSVCSIVGGMAAWLLPHDGTGAALVEEERPVPVVAVVLRATSLLTDYLRRRVPRPL